MVEDGPKHGSEQERAGGTGAAFPESYREFKVVPKSESKSGGGRSAALEPSVEESPCVLKCYINVVYYLCNLILIYTGGAPAQQSKIKLSAKCFQSGSACVSKVTS